MAAWSFKSEDVLSPDAEELFCNFKLLKRQVEKPKYMVPSLQINVLDLMGEISIAPPIAETLFG